MAEVVVVVTFTAKAERLAEAEAALVELATATHADEGCLRYALNRMRDDETVFVLVESWTSQADLDQHLRQPHVTALNEVFSDLFAGRAEIRFCTPLPVGDPVKGAV